jgi:glycosyltransferase involved in cell wall biosynthesis
VIEETVGCGVDLPPHHAYPRQLAPSPDDPQAEAAAEDEGAAQGGAPYRSHVSARGAAFRRRHRIHGSFALYGGRIDPGKGCEELIEYFATYVAEEGEASLVLMGHKLMPLPEEPFINFAGLLSEQERMQALEAATVVICPSPYESLSLLALEALATGTPILCNARSEVLVDHCLRSNGGLFYADRDEFAECLRLLVGDERLRASMGRSGRDYVRRNYRWDVVLGKFDRIIAGVRSV